MAVDTTDEYEIVNGEVEQPSQELVEVLPELARAAAVTWTRTLSVTLRTGVRVVRAAVDADSANELVEAIRGYARELLGVDELESRVRELTPPDRDGGAPELRARGADLLRRSADLSEEDGVHPAFGQVLTELAPDEARILRLLALEGAQPAVDVRATNLIGAGSQLVAPALNMLGRQGGCRHPDRVETYLVNLQRLGLVALSDVPLEEMARYQVLEAQPQVLEAIRATARAKTVHRTIRLTPFGAEFCFACFGEPPTSQSP